MAMQYVDGYTERASGSAVAQYEGAWGVAASPASRSLEDRLAVAAGALVELRLEVGYYRAAGVAVPSYLADEVRAAARTVARLERALGAY